MDDLMNRFMESYPAKLYNHRISPSREAVDTSFGNLSASISAIVASETFNRAGLLRAHAMAADKASKIVEKEETEEESTTKKQPAVVRLKQSLVETYPCSPKPLHKLVPISFNELRLGIAHHGYFILGRLCAPAFKLTSVMTLLEDDQSRVIKLAIYNALPSTCSNDEVRELFPEGAQVVIKEPYFKRYVDGTVGLRVNNPGDVVFLASSSSSSSTSSSLSSADSESDHASLRVEGNRKFAAGDWIGAIKQYSGSIIAAEKDLENLCKPRQQEAVDCNINNINHNNNNNSTSNVGVASSASISLNKCLHRFSSASTKITADNKSSSSSSTSTSSSSSSGSGNRKVLVPISNRSSSASSLSNRMSNSSNTSEEYMKNSIRMGLVSAYSNRAEALLRLKRPREALVDTMKALEIDSRHLKSSFRKGRALHALGLHSDAVACLKPLINIAPNDFDLQKALEESSIADEQNRLGNFDFSNFYHSGFTGKIPTCADYTGPVAVQRCKDSGGGRGLFVTKNVRAGDLLLVSNAIAIARVEADNIEFHLDPVTRTVNDASQEDLVTTLYGLAKSSSPKCRLMRQLLCLYYHPTGKFSGTNSGKISSVTGCDLTLPDDSLLKNPTITSVVAENSYCASEGAAIDMNRIRQIVQWNAYDEKGFSLTQHQQMKNRKKKKNIRVKEKKKKVVTMMEERERRRRRSGNNRMEGYYSSGLWFLPSFINHSCYVTASRVHIGDAMVVYAARDMKVGDEVCLPYFDILRPLRERREQSVNGWGFVCKCCRCVVEENLGEDSVKEASGMYGTLEGVPYALDDAGHVARCEKCVDEMEGAIGGIMDVERRKWMRASYAMMYLVVGHWGGREEVLEKIVDAIACVEPGHPQTLKMACVVVGEGDCGDEMKKIVVDHRMQSLCNVLFGNKLKPHVVKAVIRAVVKGLLDP